jgi:pimeloyl-ACP methyl ester carboxylesterase
MARIESLLSARLFLQPQWVEDEIYFISNLSGRLSLYRMREGGSIPQPLLPPDIALPNPDLIGGEAFRVFPALGKILVMIDHDGDEIYQPYWIPVGGDFPTPLLPEIFQGSRVHCLHTDEDANTAYFLNERLDQALNITYTVDMAKQTAQMLTESTWGRYVTGVSDDQSKVALVEGYAVGDTVLYLWTKANGLTRFYGKPMESRAEGETAPLTSFFNAEFTERDALIVANSIFEDTYGLGYIKLATPDQIQPIKIIGHQHDGIGELEMFQHCYDNRYRLRYNIDGVSWVYEGAFDEDNLTMTLDTVICGKGEIANGVLEAGHYDKNRRRYILSYSTATSSTQIYTYDHGDIVQRTDERVLGIDPALLSTGEDASFASHDGLRISARLYLPAPELGFEGKRPLVYYVHGGPQSQERPNFAWFSMPLIQFLTLNGFAVLVPNVRGSTGYGLSYTKHVDKDWGGQDRLDHVHALKLLADDPRIDTARAGVVGRSYGGYMTLTLASHHPELWKAAVDMFGPYNLISFSERIPETWKPYFAVALGDPVADRDFLLERSPSSHIEQITMPLLVIQGKNDPRVVEGESRDVVEQLRGMGKQVDYLMFEDEGHDVLKFKNRVTCYSAITDFFKQHLNP